MFKVGDRVEVTVERDPFYGIEGEVKETYISESGWENLNILLDDNEDIGLLWFGHNELRKVEQA